MATAPYMTEAEFREGTIMASETLDELGQRRPGFVLARLVKRTAAMNARLAKRYAVPFATPYPEQAQLWLDALVTLDCFKAAGFAPSSDQDKTIVDEAAAAEKQIAEAADSSEGLFDLPLRSNTTASGIEKGGPLGYSEASPYTWLDVQREAVQGG